MKTPIKNSIEYKYFGPEPKEYSIKALNWYNKFCDRKDYQQFLKGFMKRNKINKVLPSYIPASIGVVAYYLTTNREVPELSKQKLFTFIDNLSDLTESTAEIKKVPKKSIQDYIKDQVHNICAVLDGEIDTLLNDFRHTFDIKEFSKDIKPVHARSIKDFYMKQYEDTLMDDEFTKEGYSYMKTSEMNIYKKFLKSIIDEMNIILSVKPVKRIIKRKPVPAYKKVQKLKYLLEYKLDDTFKSIDPETIISTDTLVLYNTKTGYIHVYYSKPGGIDVSGTTLKNINNSISFKTKIKPKEVNDILKRITSTKPRASKFIKDVEKRTKTNNRINEYTLLLKVL